MANPKHVALLEKGVEYWNEWREENPDVRPDLSRSKFSRADLKGADFFRANLKQVNLLEADLERADLSGVNLSQADLSGANLSEAYLIIADLYNANLWEANLWETNLKRANLKRADLRGANLSGAYLLGANLERANLERANLINANLWEANLKGANLQKTSLTSTNLDDLDLSQTIGLETCIHEYSSSIGTDTLVRSKGKIPIEFLRGCGLSDWEIESVKLYQPGLSNEIVTNIIYRIHDIRTTQAVQINPLFISYTHDDSEFVDKVGQLLTKQGVRFWRDVHHATAGKLEKQVDRAMRLHPTVLLVLSKNSTNSDWVEHEAKKARKLEQELGRDVICPVALDDSWKDCDWPERLREQIEEYNILDFSDWEDPEKFDTLFSKLLQGLDLFYKK